MHVTRVALANFRNFEQQEIILSPRTNVFAGRNGQGKTNLLEAVYLLGYGRSFRTAAARECIRHGQASALVRGTVEQNTLVRELQVQLWPQDKKLYLHAKAVGLEEFAGNLHVLAFTGEHLRIVRGSPADRRAFLDRAMITVFPGHLRYLASYGRALKQRNRLLSFRNRGDSIEDDTLESWEAMLVQSGTRLVRNRHAYVEQMRNVLPGRLFEAEELTMSYSTGVPVEDDIGSMESVFRERLRATRDSDARLGFTSVGPHRDDLRLFADGRSLADFGSAGQQRSSLIALYFAQMEIHKHTHGFYPIFLVDDVEAELDDARLRVFLGYLFERTQTLVTTAKPSILPQLAGELVRFEVESGRVFPG